MSDGLLTNLFFFNRPEDYEDTYTIIRSPMILYPAARTRQFIMQEPDFSKPAGPRQDKVVSLVNKIKRSCDLESRDMSSSGLANHLMENHTVICNLKNIVATLGKELTLFLFSLCALLCCCIRENLCSHATHGKPRE